MEFAPSQIIKRVYERGHPEKQRNDYSLSNITNETSKMAQKQDFQSDTTGNIAVQLDGRMWEMPIYNKDTLELAISALRMLSKKFGVLIETKNDPDFTNTQTSSAELQHQDESA